MPQGLGTENHPIKPKAHQMQSSHPGSELKRTLQEQLIKFA